MTRCPWWLLAWALAGCPQAPRQDLRDELARTGSVLRQDGQDPQPIGDRRFVVAPGEAEGVLSGTVVGLRQGWLEIQSQPRGLQRLLGRPPQLLHMQPFDHGAFSIPLPPGLDEVVVVGVKAEQPGPANGGQVPMFASVGPVRLRGRDVHVELAPGDEPAAGPTGP